MDQEDRIYHALFKYTQALSVALGYRDSFTRLHSNRVLHLAEELGTHCALSNRELIILKIGASFHDIGKIGIPDQILRKPSTLDTPETEKMRKHSEIGEEIMKATELDGAELAAVVIRHHHEHFDGLGYPDGLAGEAIPIGSRIISIVDSYDAMAETRPYHNARQHTKIMDLLHEEIGKKHDPEIMRMFVKIIEKSKLKAT